MAHKALALALKCIAIHPETDKSACTVFHVLDTQLGSAQQSQLGLPHL